MLDILNQVFKKMQRRFKKNRDAYKYLGWKIDAELVTGLEKLIEQKEKLIEQKEN